MAVGSGAGGGCKRGRGSAHPTHARRRVAVVLPPGRGGAAGGTGRRHLAAAPPVEEPGRAEGGRMTRAHGILGILWVAALAWAYALTQSNWWPVSEAARPVP